MPLQATSGAASYDGFGGGVAVVPNYIEDVFSTWLYTGNGSTQTITNGIDLAGKGGLVWLKGRNTAGTEHELTDTARGTNSNGRALNSNDAQANQLGDLTSFTSSGFGLSYNTANGNLSGESVVSWTFRKQPKFFDVVTYTGDGTSNRAISHSLGSAPGCIIAKRTDAVGNWNVYHRGVSPANDNTLTLNTTSSASGGGQDIWGNGVNVTTPTTTSFYVAGQNNNNGVNYVAYLFAHNAGGFGLTGTDNVISCGSIGVSSGGQYFDVNLGYEPQWLLIKGTATSNWEVYDSMRGLTNNDVSTAVSNVLRPNTSGAESNTSSIQITSTGFRYYGNSYNSWGTMIYIAIRRGPMKTPTTGTSVFSPYVTTSVAASASGSTLANALYSTNFVVDMGLQVNKSGTDGWYMGPRLAGNRYMKTETTAAEAASSQLVYDSNVGAWGFNGSYGLYSFRRAPGFFDVVCYTGTGSYPFTINHNLGVVPEMMIFKKRIYDAEQENWYVYQNSITSPNSNWYQNVLILNSTTSSGGASSFITTAPTSTAITAAGSLAESGDPWVVYLFASCPGVSKVGSYTGDGTVDRVIDCGFTSGARFILLKKTSTTSGWYVYDTARGISTSGESSLLLNTTAAESGSADVIDPASSGFSVGTSGSDFFNESGVRYIFLAIA